MKLSEIKIKLLTTKKYWKIAVPAFLVLCFALGYFFFWHSREVKAGWWNESWAYRKALTINGSKVTGNLVNFPILVNLSDANLSSHAQTDGDDIVFTSDKGEVLKHEIEKYDSANGELVAWVKIPSMITNNNFDIYMYYGNAGVSAQEEPQAVWDENFVLVHHNEDTDDSTQYSNDGVNTGAAAYPAGKLNGAYDFSDATDNITIATSTSLDMISTLTTSAWVYVDGAGGGSYGRILDHDYRGSGWIFYVDATKYIFADFGWIDQEGYWTTPMSTAGWYHVTVTYDNSSTANNPIFYVNGEVTAVTETWTPTGAHTASSSNTIIGNNDSGSRNFDGRIDENRVSNIIRSSSWITTEYNNQSSTSTFYSVQAQETGPGPVAYWRFDEGQGITTYNSMASFSSATSSQTTIAVEFISSSTRQSNAGGTTNTDSFSVTVPSDADIAVVVMNGWIANLHYNSLFDKLSWDNSASIQFTDIVWGQYEATGGDYDDVSAMALYMKSSDANWPGSGAKTLYWSANGTIGEGFNIAVLFYKNVDISGDPIVATDTDYGNVQNWTSSLSGVGEDDMAIVSGYSMYSDTNPNPSGSGQTVMWDSAVYGSDYLAIGQELGESAMEIYFGSTYEWSNPIAFALKAATVEGSAATTTDGIITGATWQDESQCVSGKCLYFDGSGDKVEAGDIDF